MVTMITLKCPICKKEFEKIAYEYNRQKAKNPNAECYCSKACACIGGHSKQKCLTINRTCPVCGKVFEATTSKKSATFCSRSCASKGSVTDKRRSAGKAASKNNFIHNASSIQNVLKSREAWKYEDIKKLLEFLGVNHEFEFLIDNFIYDLALIDKKLLIEFDGPEHSYLDESQKNEVAKNHGWTVIRQKIKPNTVINPGFLYNLL